MTDKEIIDWLRSNTLNISLETGKLTYLHKTYQFTIQLHRKNYIVSFGETVRLKTTCFSKVRHFFEFGIFKKEATSIKSYIQRQMKKGATTPFQLKIRKKAK